MKNNANNLVKLSPSGNCRMGETEVTFYRSGNRIWFDKKAIEFVLTGKNQHNLLGQYKDPKNHSRIFDEVSHQPVDVISPTGVKNYLKKAWSVDDMARRAYYDGLKNMDKPQREEKQAEPLQMPIFNADIPVKINDFVKISKNSDGKMDVEFHVSGGSRDEKNQNLVKMLISVASDIANGNIVVQSL